MRELLLRVLNVVELPWCDGAERRQDLFGGNHVFQRFYMDWLVSAGLVVVGDRATTLGDRLSAEGRAALLMLRATRDRAWIDLPFADVIDAVRAAGAESVSAEALDATLHRFELGLTPLLHLFARETVGRLHLVTIITWMSAVEGWPDRRRLWTGKAFVRYLAAGWKWNQRIARALRRIEDRCRSLRLVPLSIRFRGQLLRGNAADPQFDRLSGFCPR